MSRQGAGTSVPAPLACPGRCVCRWAAARPRDRHTRACGSEWSISRPALALPPPTGTAARPFGPAGALHTSGARCADGRGASSRSPPWPCRRPPAPRPGRLDRPVPSTPVARGVLMGCSARRLVVRPGPAGLAAASNWVVLIVCVLPTRPCRRPQAPLPGPMVPSTPAPPCRCSDVLLGPSNFACNSPESISSIEI